MSEPKVFVSKITHEGETIIKIFDYKDFDAAVEFAKQIELNDFYICVFVALQKNGIPCAERRIYEIFRPTANK